MAKAALNMMTKSIADGFYSSNIYANAVDPGWVSLMMPGATYTFPFSINLELLENIYDISQWKSTIDRKRRGNEGTRPSLCWPNTNIRSLWTTFPKLY